MYKLFGILAFLFTGIIQAQKTNEIDSVLQIARNTASDSVRITTFQKVSKLYAPINFDSAYYYGRKSLQLAEKIENSNLIVESYTKIGLAYDYQSRIDSTLFWYNKALSLANKHHDTLQLIKVLNHIGVSYYFNTKYDLSIQNYYKSLALSRKISDSVGIARCFNNIGLIHEKQKNYTDAIDYYLKSLAIKETFESKEGLVYPLTNLSNIAIINNDFEEGKKYMFRLLSVSKELKDTTLIAANYSNLAKLYANNNHLNQSNIYLQKSLDLLGSITDKFEYSQLLFDLAGTYEKKGAFKKAEKTYLEAIAISEKIRKRELLEKAYKELSDLYRKNKEYTKALVYYDKFTTVKDSFFTVDKLRAVSEIETKYETEKKEQQINLLKTNVKQQETKQRLWFWIAGLAVLLALLSIFYFSSYKKRSAELEKKNLLINKTLAEKETLLKEIHHRVKNNLQVIASILSLQIRYLKSPKAIAAITDSQHRINSISLIHQKLYSEKSITAVNMKDYIDDLVDSIINSLHFDSNKIRYYSSIENLLLDVNTVTPIGLILNELVTNSLKHNMNTDTLKLTISLMKKDDFLYLSIKDNGKGVPVGFDFRNTDSYGMKMIESVAKKLKASIKFENNNGLVVSLTIKKYNEMSL